MLIICWNLWIISSYSPCFITQDLLQKPCRLCKSCMYAYVYILQRISMQLLWACNRKTNFRIFQIKKLDYIILCRLDGIPCRREIKGEPNGHQGSICVHCIYRGLIASISDTQEHVLCLPKKSRDMGITELSVEPFYAQAWLDTKFQA